MAHRHVSHRRTPVEISLTPTITKADSDPGDFANYVGQSSIGFRGDPESTLALYKQVLIRPEGLKDPYLLPEFVNRTRVLRGFAQRLVRRDGLESLGEAVEFFCENPIDNWPLPVLDRRERARILSLVVPPERDGDYRVVLGRNPDGTPLWDYTHKGVGNEQSRTNRTNQATSVQGGVFSFQETAKRVPITNSGPSESAGHDPPR